MKAEVQLLKDADVFPAENVLRKALGEDVFVVYQELHKTITGNQLGLNPEWNYYKDGKAWLCKVTYKKKTVFWLSIWEKYIKTGFYFTEKTRQGVLDLKISKKIKQEFIEAKACGKLMPLILVIDKKEQLEDIWKIIEYKKSLK